MQFNGHSDIVFTYVQADSFICEMQKPANKLILSAKRIPYADYIVAINTDGQVCEHGRFDDLVSSGGYISSFSFQPVDWTFNPDFKPVRIGSASPAPPNKPNIIESSGELEAEANRRTGDSSIYLYYVKAIGWTPTLVFVFCIAAFVICISFPSTLPSPHGLFWQYTDLRTTAIWVNWWAAANIEEPYQRLGFYLGIYFMLGALGIIFLIASCWQILITMVPRSGENFHLTLLRTVLR
jgi:hypothetical protein